MGSRSDPPPGVTGQGPVEARPRKPPPVWWKRVLRTAGLTVFVYYTLCLVAVLFFEDAFIYFPEKGDPGKSAGEDIFLTTTDGVRIHGWYASHPEARLTLLWFHGNAGSLRDRRSMIRGLRNLPANVLAIDYRGYGRSEGTPDEEGLHKDSRAAYDWLCAKTTPDRIVIFGKSLGGGPACELASRVPCGGLILQSTFTSAPDMASRMMPLFPARWFMKSRYDNLSKIAAITVPKLFVHSRADEVIPFSMGEALHAAAAAPKECAWFERADHNNLPGVQSKAYYARLKQFLDGLEK